VNDLLAWPEFGELGLDRPVLLLGAARILGLPG
jgi:hypothetical protein